MQSALQRRRTTKRSSCSFCHLKRLIKLHESSAQRLLGRGESVVVDTFDADFTALAEMVTAGVGEEEGAVLQEQVSLLRCGCFGR